MIRKLLHGGVSGPRSLDRGGRLRDPRERCYANLQGTGFVCPRAEGLSITGERGSRQTAAARAGRTRPAPRGSRGRPRPRPAGRSDAELTSAAAPLSYEILGIRTTRSSRVSIAGTVQSAAGSRTPGSCAASTGRRLRHRGLFVSAAGFRGVGHSRQHRRCAAAAGHGGGNQAE